MTMTDRKLLEIRLFRVQPGTRDEFDRISREGTVPMMRRYGFTVLACGPLVDDEDGYYLVRVFDSVQQRLELSQRLYASQEWLDNYEQPVTAMIVDYRNALLPAHDAVTALVPGGAVG
ncbi:NIPSNAP family protein [Micromonospora sp. NPDC126480]|uniref:NIPSNAP family protein n=1 Tax=Micromonospora sp. NPDC126480 TaxID=3155312 RepID=UPI0033199E51